jgi:GNAT superfamily N-acetyltransferase
MDDPTSTWRLRVELTDRPGTLARLATSLAGKGCNILALTVLPVPNGVIDDLIVSTPNALLPAELVTLVRAVGGRCAGITKAHMTDLTDAPTAALRIAAKLVDHTAGYAESVRELLGADSAEPAGPAAAPTDTPPARHITAGLAYDADAWRSPIPAADCASTGQAAPPAADGHDTRQTTNPATNPAADRATGRTPGRQATVHAADGTGLEMRRGWAPFTEVELARSAALADLVRASGARGIGATAVVTDDGAGVVLRESLPSDTDGVAAMHDRCSSATLVARYHGGSRGMPCRLLHRLLAPPRGRTVVAVMGHQVVAVGQLINTGDPGVGELSLLVEDDWQGKGIGTALLTHLVRTARGAGHTTVFGWCHPGEHRLPAAAERAGYPVSTRFEGNLLRVSLDITPTHHVLAHRDAPLANR